MNWRASSKRIGRVDRIGQRRTVHAITLVARDTAEDLVVARLARRLARVAATLGERDRLAALLTDTRTARAVIAGAAPEIEDEGPAAPPLPRADARDFPADTVAAQLARSIPDPPLPSGTCVARLRASHALGPGWVAIVRAATVTDRGLVAERPFLYHVAARKLAKPSTHHEARQIARAPIAFAEAAAAGDPEVCRWKDGVRATHEAAVRQHLSREEALGREDAPEGEVQPGLFDGRATREAARIFLRDDRRHRDHERYVKALEDARSVRLECTVTALAIVWR